MREAKLHLEHMLLVEEEYWKVRSHTNWLSQGDKNTSYFHHHASQRKKKNHIASLEDDQGRMMEEQTLMEEHVANFFELLFSNGAKGGNMEEIFQNTDIPSLNE